MKKNWKDIAKYWHRYAQILSKGMKSDIDFIEFLLQSDEDLMDMIDEQRKEIKDLEGIIRRIECQN